MSRSSKLSIERKLRYAMMTTAEIGLLVSLLVFSVSDYMKSRDAMLERIQNLAQVFSTNSQASVYFEDKAAATELLQGLNVVSTIQEAHLFLANGERLASYPKTDTFTFKAQPTPPSERTARFSDDYLDVSQAVYFDGKPLGTIVIRASLDSLYQQITLNVLAALMITILAIIITYIFAFRMQRQITKPITELAQAMKQVSIYQFYDHELEKKSNDEIGQLYDNFNEMMNQISSRDKQLNEHKKELESTVELRTEALNLANTNLQTAIEEANQAKETALEAAQTKSAFLANMSHEIRTPMNGVLGMLELMKDTELDKGQRDYLNTAYGSADALLQIINDILDFSKIEAGKLELETIDMSPSALTDDVCALLAGKAREKTIELGCYTDVNMPESVKGDPVRLRQVLTNLIGNAVKFTTEGEVIVRALYKGKDGSRHKVRFEVEDTGIGIAADVIPKLFEPFSQADNSTTRKFGGTGLGLTISRQLVELMDSQLQVTSEQGKGSCFFFEVDFEESHTLPVKSQKHMVLNDIYALVVDDNPTNREIMHKYLEAWNIDHASAENGIQALEKMKDAVTAGRPFDLVYLDMQMPDMDGLEVSKAIASDNKLHSARRIMLTSAGQLSMREQRAADLHGCLAKPFRQSQLLDATMEVMNRHSAIPDEVPEAPKSTEKQFGEQIPVLLVEDNPVNQKVAIAMLKKLGLSNVDIAANGQEAVDMSAGKGYTFALMDCQMPVMSGYEATNVIRKREQQQKGIHLPIIAMTANAMEGDREKCIKAGMDDYISKPIKVDSLKNIISPWLS
ncbi:response regulator [Parendozoicomonas haliclonae]|uniref:Sensory/regulatory protein RpfC n=1 Tax=Parendozoicomonas haliclonae TaxID=1960125 RepID=A0A1X7AIH3_9GAMM|nr:response regulator [Parendozoicomonas haliclonae]SMA45196.1 Signal transduction histidine-protein kinase BarA [Parendozoicomonas haliclonae]